MAQVVRASPRARDRLRSAGSGAGICPFGVECRRGGAEVMARPRNLVRDVREYSFTQSAPGVAERGMAHPCAGTFARRRHRSSGLIQAAVDSPP